MNSAFRLLAVVIAFWTPILAEIPAPPGRVVDIDGARLHINCTGTAEPAVILEAGLPGSSLDWTLTQPEVGKLTRVCSYDRAGFGWSSLRKQPRTGNQIAEDLHALLAAAGVPSPYVLVGHSMGGVYVRMFASKYPDQVIGMVLVDPISEDFATFGTPNIHSYWQPKLPPPQQNAEGAKVSRAPEVQAILNQLRSSETWKTGEQQERDAVMTSFTEVRKLNRRLAMIPLIVLSAGRRLEWLDRAPVEAWKKQQLEMELSTISAQGEWFPVPGANHYIQLSHPAVVIEAIQRVVSTARLLKPSRN